ncbi:MAG: VWA domain-containing protein [Gammaproteobacteria bacterium]|nr:MAG: VWA domain-containing protein [Gammaproteobacteria bacterium]
MKRRSISPFSLSFLDIMFCGFGAVVLLVLILDHDTVRTRETTFANLRAEAVDLERQAIRARQDLSADKAALQAASESRVEADEAIRAIDAEIAALELEMAEMSRLTLARVASIEQLKSDLKNLDSESKRLAAEAKAAKDPGNRVLKVVGDGDRQYLTGLKVGGKRILILVDASASMLDETVVNVIRRRNMSEASKRAAPKWRRTLATAEWLVSQLPRGSRFQLVSFNTRARVTATGSGGTWLDTDNREQVNRAVTGLQETIPEKGTSLERAFEVVKKMQPRPDNVILITDGLPTQGRGKPRGTTVSADARLKHYFAAVRALPEKIPVNIILLPMEGDAYAAAAFWQLAAATGGSFMTPARDWP